jgi:HEAT repeat protein
MTEPEFNDWKRRITSAEPSDRSDAADNPPLRPRKEIVRCLIKALKDENSLVRTCTADSLGMHAVKPAREALRKALGQEDDELARAFMFSSLGAVGQLGDLERLTKELSAELSPLLSIHAALGLAFCGENVSMNRLIKALDKGDFNQIPAANLIGEYLGSHRLYVSLLRRKVTKQLRRKDLMPSQTEALESLLSQIEASYKLDD